MMQHILAVLDQRHSSSVAFRAARRWAEKTGARLSVFLPTEAIPPIGVHLGPGLLASVEHTAEMQAEQWLNDFLSGENQSVERHAAVVHRWDQGVRHEFERIKADLVFISRESAPTESEWKKLLRQLPGPTCIVRDDEPPRSILAAVSASPEDPAHQILNDTVLQYTQNWSRLWDVSFKIASALPNPLELAPLMGETYVASYVEEEMTQALRSGLVAWLERHSLPQDILCTRVGVVEAILAQEIDDSHANWVVMGTVGRRAMAAWFAGNSAERIERHLQVNVLLLRPQDFQED